MTSRGEHRRWAQLTFAPDYAAPTPLWEIARDGGGVLSVEHLTTLGLTDHLITGLVDWQRFFDAHFSSTRPHWDSPGSAERFGSRGKRLHDRLTRALPDVQITLDLWPLEPKLS